MLKYFRHANKHLIKTSKRLCSDTNKYNDLRSRMMQFSKVVDTGDVVLDWSEIVKSFMNKNEFDTDLDKEIKDLFSSRGI